MTPEPFPQVRPQQHGYCHQPWSVEHHSESPSFIGGFLRTNFELICRRLTQNRWGHFTCLRNSWRNYTCLLLSFFQPPVEDAVSDRLCRILAHPIMNNMTKSDNILDNADNNWNVKCLRNQLSVESEPMFLIVTQTFLFSIPPQRNILILTV